MSIDDVYADWAHKHVRTFEQASNVARRRIRGELDAETLAALQGGQERAQAMRAERNARKAYLALDGGLPELIEWEEALDRLLALDPDALG